MGRDELKDKLVNGVRVKVRTGKSNNGKVKWGDTVETSLLITERNGEIVSIAPNTLTWPVYKLNNYIESEDMFKEGKYCMEVSFIEEENDNEERHDEGTEVD